MTKMTRFRRPVDMQQGAPRQRTATQNLLSKYFAQDFFTYTIPIVVPLAAGDTTDGNVTLDADSDFLWQKFTAMVFDNTDVPLSPINVGLTLIITDTGSGRNLSNTPVPLNGISGSGELPFILPTPKVFKASGQIQVTLANPSATEYNRVYLNFIGQKCYLKAQPLM